VNQLIVLADAVRSPAPATTPALISRYKRKSMFVSFVFVLLGGGWAALAPISGAVIASGHVVVESNARSVQHLTGGVVERIHVRDGQTVAAGELLVKLDETQARAQLSIAQTQRNELVVRKARLEAEHAGLSAIEPSGDLAALMDDPGVQRQLALEQIVLDSRVKIAEGQAQQFKERVRQVELDIDGLAEQLKARRRQLDLITAEVQGLEGLFARNLVSMVRISGVRREQARLQGDIGNVNSDIARSRAKIAETELQLIQLEQQRRNDINQEAREVATKLAEANERIVILQDTLNRVEIRSPAAGVVHQLSVFTQGGVVRAGDTLMRIVPTNEVMVFEARIQPKDIDQVRVGQPVAVRLLAANQATAQSIAGTLERVSPDITLDAATQQRYFTAKVSVNPAVVEPRTAATKLVPGMPADLFIQTDERTALSYMLKPIIDQATRAFRER
jgi:HlyD family secretion protein